MFQGNAFQADAFQRGPPEPEVVVIPPGGGGSGGRRRFFDYPNIVDDPALFRRPGEAPEKIPRYVEGDPASAVTEGEVEPTVRQRVEGPSSLTDLGSSPIRLRAPRLPGIETGPPEVKRARKAPKAPTTAKTAKAHVLADPAVQPELSLDAKIEQAVKRQIDELRSVSEREAQEEEELRILRKFEFL